MTGWLVFFVYVVSGLVTGVWFLRWTFRDEGEVAPEHYAIAVLIACCGFIALGFAFLCFGLSFFRHRLIPELGVKERAEAAAARERTILAQQDEINIERAKLGLKPLDWT